MNLPDSLGSTTERSVPDMLFNPKSIAVFGATDDPGRLTARPIALLGRHGYSGRVYVVNPRRPKVFGQSTYPDLTAVPTVPDIALIMLGGEHALTALADCAQAGVRYALVVGDILAGLRMDGRLPDDPKTAETIKLIRSSGMRIIGPNSNGVADAHSRLVLGMQPNLLKDSLLPGSVGLAFQSGAMATAVMKRLTTAGVGFGPVAACGNEFDLTAAEVARSMLDMPTVQTVLMFVEGLHPHDGKNLLATAQKSAVVGKPLVVMKVGRSPQSAAAVAAHTGKIVGDQGVYTGAFRQYGVVDVGTIEELVIAAQLAAGPTIPGRRIAFLSGSGGLNTLAVDTVTAAGLDLPDLTDESVAGLAADLPYVTPANPLDLTGMANEHPGALYQAISALARTELDALVVGLNYHDEPVVDARVDGATRARAELGLPVYVYSAAGGLTDRHLRMLADGGIPVFDDMKRFVETYARFAEASERRERVAHRTTSRCAPFAGALPSSGNRIDGSALRRAGLPYVEEVFCADLETLVIQAEDLGFPVAVKVAGKEFVHKSDIGGVHLGITDRLGLERAWVMIHDAVGENRFGGVTVQRMISPGREMLVSGLRDAAFGAVVSVGLGGLYTEVFADAAVRVCPVTRDDVLDAIASLRSAALLGGLRGELARDVDALVRIVQSVSELMLARPGLNLIEMNPVIVHAQGTGADIVDLVIAEADAANDARRAE